MIKVKTQRHINWEKVRKWTKSLFKKMNELTQITNAKIYFIMNRNERFQIYKSTDQFKWSSLKQEMINCSIAKIRALFNTMILEEALSHLKISRFNELWICKWRGKKSKKHWRNQWWTSDEAQAWRWWWFHWLSTTHFLCFQAFSSVEIIS